MSFVDDWAAVSDDEAPPIVGRKGLEFLDTEELFGSDSEPVSAEKDIEVASSGHASDIVSSSSSSSPPAKPRGRKRTGQGSSGGEESGMGEALVLVETKGPFAGLGPPTTPQSVVVKSFLCVTGNPLRAPVVVHPLHRDAAGGEWVVLNEHMHWLRRAVGCGSTHWTAQFQAAVTALRVEVRDRLTAARTPTRVAAQAQVRQQLMLDEEEDCDQDAATKSQKGCANSRRPKGTSSAEALPIILHGFEVKALNSTRPVAVEATQASLTAIIAFCKAKIGAGEPVLKKMSRQEVLPAPTPEPAPAEPSFQMPVSDCPGFMGKVTWHPSVSAWAAHWKNADKKTIVTRFPVKVQTRGALALVAEGAALETFAQVRRRRYLEAVAHWNQWDNSTRDRIVLPDNSAP